MTYDRFEQLPVWQAAIKLGQQVYALTKATPSRRQRSLRDQLERAAVSVSNNIAEGFERGTTQELLTFLYIARGSAGEVRSMLCLIEGIPEFADAQLSGAADPRSEISNLKPPKSEASNLKSLKSEISNLKLQAQAISRQLRGWADSLQNSGIKGQRYLDERSQRVSSAKRGRESFLAELEEIRKGRKSA